MRNLITLLRWTMLASRRKAWIARRDHRSVRFLCYSAVAALGEAAAVWVSLSFIVALLLAGMIGAALVMTFVTAVLIVPGPIAQHVAIPRGHHRLAYWLIMIDELGRAHADQPARLAAARAAARMGSPPAAVAWMTRGRPARLDATEVAVQAVLAHGRGDRDDARALFLSIAGFADPAPEARELAAEWLALDDAERGAWADLVARGRLRARPARGAHRTPTAIRTTAEDTSDRTAARGVPLWPATSMTFLLEGVGARLIDDADAPSVVGLWLRWLEAPARRHTFALARRASAPPITARTSSASDAAPASSTASESAAAPAPVSGSASSPRPDPAFDVLALALRAHARALTLATSDAIAAAAKAWDATVHPSGLAVAVARRAITIGAPVDAADHALAALDDQVTAELAALIEQRAIPLAILQAHAPGSAMLAAIGRRARRELLTRLELTCDRIGDRARDDRNLDAIDELRTFAAVRRAYEQAAIQGGADLERLAYPHVHGELLTWTVWLWNQRHEYLLSHLVTAWLYERALAVGDAEAIELHGANGAIAIPAP